MNGWIGVDLDGTLAQYDKWVSPAHIGEPIAVMVDRVNGWLAAGLDVRIFTARVSHDGTFERQLEAGVARHSIEKWCEQYFGRVLPITNVKDYAMIELWDDRAVQVEANTGNLIGFSTRGL